MATSVDEGPPSSNKASAWFVMITTLYFIFRYQTSKGKGTGEQEQANNTVWASVYALLLIVGEYFISLGVTKSLCGTNQWDTAFYMTFVPWLLIFGVLNVMLIVFPGWLSPFANTFGYAACKLAGLSGTMDQLFRFKRAGEPTGTTPTGKADTSETEELLGKIYGDKSLLINEVTVNNFDDFWLNMWPLFSRKAQQLSNPSKPSSPNPLKSQLLALVQLKETVAMWVWYMLAGLLVVSVSYNYVAAAKCQRTPEEVQARHQEFVEKERAAAQKRNEDNKVYTTTE